MTPSDWDQLFDALTTGNDNNLHELFQKLGEYFLRVAQNRLSSKPTMTEDAHECANDALLAIWQAMQKRAAPQYRHAMKSWATRIVIRKALDRLRSRGYSITPNQTDQSKPIKETVELVETIESPQDEIEETLNKVTKTEALRRIFCHPKLKPDEKNILWLTYIEPTDDTEIAQRLNMPQATVRVKRMRAIQKLCDDPDLLDLLRSLFNRYNDKDK